MSLSELQVRSRDHDVRSQHIVSSIGPTYLHTSRMPIARADLRDLSAELKLSTLFTGDRFQRTHHRGKPALRIFHSLHQIRMTQQVVQRRGMRRVRRQEHCRVRQHLPQAHINKSLIDEPFQPHRQHLQQFAVIGTNLRNKESAWGRKRGVKEVLDRELVSFTGARKVLLQLLSSAGLN